MSRKIIPALLVSLFVLVIFTSVIPQGGETGDQEGQFVPPTQYDHLKELDWMIGEWVDKSDDATIETTVDWDKYKNFITQRFSITIEGEPSLEGRQVIGWDPVKQQIRSWVFDSDGTFGEGTWKKEGKTWVVETAQTLADGRRASAINVYTPLGKESYSWESTGREVGGEILPDIDPVTVTRKKG